MNTKALKTLEYDKILKMLTDHATSDPGRLICDNLKPSDNYSEILTSLRETTDACTRIRMKGYISFGDVHDLGDTLKRLEVHGTLTMPELMRISSLLSLSHRVIAYGRHDDSEENAADFDSLEGYFKILNSLPTINRQLSISIISEDTMSDEASPELHRIRKQTKSIQDRMHTELNNILNAHRAYLMDPVIAMRDGSYCLPVKSEYKSKVPGVVHDQSSTGSTIFIEPMAVIKLNNNIRELEIAEQKEIERILEVLSASVAPYIEEIRCDMNTLSHLDFVFAKAKLAKDMKASEPVFNQRGYVDIKDGRHPLLDQNQVVPISISLGDSYDLLIITGPNTGGKTVSLKTIGLFTLMGQSGLHIPAFEGSSLAVFKSVFADIGDEQSIEQSLSTFSGHMKNIVEILGAADADSLCLFDELGAGTDPTEGAALAISVLSFLHRMKVRTVATTHYSELKVFALNTPEVENACCEFDVETLRPTYRILMGIPGKSNAFAISKKLGLPDYIIDEAKTHITKDSEAFEDLLAKLESDRVTMERERAEIEKYKHEIKTLRDTYELQDEKLDERKDKLIRQAKEEAARILSEAKETADETIRNINRYASDSGLGKALEKERDRIRTSLKDAESGVGIKPAKAKSSGAKPPTLKLGDRVRVLSMNLEGTVSSLPNDKGKLFVQMGILRSQVDAGDLELIHEATISGPQGAVSTSKSRKSSTLMKSMAVSPEINLIGMNVDEACSNLDKYLDDALLSHLPSVRIIHGRGTGALKNGIHAYLKKQSFIKSYKLADFEDGGTAITIVEFK